MTSDPATSLGSKILGLFVDIDTSPRPGAAATPAPKAAVAAAKGDAVDQQMLTTLREQIAARSTAYVTLTEAAQRLSGVIPDQTTRLKAAFAMVSGEGIRSVASITQAIDVHIADLEGERMRFKQASDAQTSVKSAALRKQADALAAQAAAGSAQIERMQADIASLQADSVQTAAQCRALNAQADQADTEITAISAAFDRAVDFLKADLAANKTTLNAILA